MRRVMVLESDCLVDNLDFPARLDHAWLLIARAIHLRLYRRSTTGKFVPAAIRNFSKTSSSSYRLTVDRRYTWTDCEPLDAQEIEVALLRGISLGMLASVQATSAEEIDVSVPPDAILTAEALASPIFTITPSCRSAKSKPTHVCGPYALESRSSDNRVMTFARRSAYPDHGLGPERVSVVVTENRNQGARLLVAGKIHLSCPLGANPDIFQRMSPLNPLTNELTNLGMFLVSRMAAPSTGTLELMRLIAGTLDRSRLAETTSGTFVPMANVSRLFDFATPDFEGVSFSNDSQGTPDSEILVHGRHPRRTLPLWYVEFEPNARIAADLCDQLFDRLAIKCCPVRISYDDYLAGRFPEGDGLSLEIIQPSLTEAFFRKWWHFIESPDSLARTPSCDEPDDPETMNFIIPLLQARTSLMSACKAYQGKRLADSEGLIDWGLL